MGLHTNFALLSMVTILTLAMGATPSYDLEYDDDGIIKLGTGTFDGFTSGQPLALVAFIAPWCGHCKRFKPQFAMVAEKFKDNPNIAFARVDCVAHEKLYEKYKILGFPTIKLFRHGVYSETYDFARKADAVTSYVKKWLARPDLEKGFIKVANMDALQTFLDETFSDQKKPAQAVLLTMFDKVGKHHEMERRLTAGAVSSGGTGARHIVSDSQDIQDTFFRDENRTHPETGEPILSELPQTVMLTPWRQAHIIVPNQIVYNPVRMDMFLQSYAWPLVVTHHFKNSSMLFKKRPGFNVHVILYTDAEKGSEKYETQLDALSDAAKQYRGKAVFVIADPEDNAFTKGSLKQLDVTEDYPALRIVGSSARTSRSVRKIRYAPIDPAAAKKASEDLRKAGRRLLHKIIVDFLEDYFAKKLDDIGTMKRKYQESLKKAKTEL